MEKRLLLAVFLSMLVVFGFQSMFVPKKNTLVGSQHVDNKDVVDYKINEKIVNDLKRSEKPSFEEKQEIADFKEETFVEKSNGFDIVFSNKGGNIQDVRISKYNYDILVNNFANFEEFKNKLFQYSRISSREHLMKYEGSGWEVSKKYNFTEPFFVEIDVEIKNIGETQKEISAIEMMNINLSRMDKTKHSSDWTLFEYSFKTDKKIIRKDNVNNFNEKWNKEEDAFVEWIGFRDRYFAAIIKPQEVLKKYYTKERGTDQLGLGGNLSTEEIFPGQTKIYRFSLYLGPQKLDLLKKSNIGFEKIMVFSNWGWLDAISKGIYWLLGAINKIIPSWGICIILISLIVYGAMYPLTAKSLVSMRKMQALQPKMAELKKKYEKSPEKMNQEIMQLYKQNGVNPLSGCLPMLLQMPIFIGLYQVLWRSFYFRGEGFLWIKDLSMPDRLFKFPGNLPFFGEYFNFLPFLMVIIMFFQQKMNMSSLSSGDPEQQTQQKMMLYFMPGMMGFIFYNFASGLCLYFVVFYALSGISQWKIAKTLK